MDLGIAGKSVFFTGGSKGMGREAATMLAAEGCKVAIVARTKHDIDEAVEAIKDAGGTAIGVSADITNRDDVERAVAEVRAAFGPPLIAIGQTKFNIPGDFSDITDYEHYVESFRSYTMSQVYLLHEVLPGMQAAQWGRYVHIGSATAKEPEGAIHHVIANATRPSTIGLLKTVADEYARVRHHREHRGSGLDRHAERVRLPRDPGRDHHRRGAPRLDDPARQRARGTDG